MAPSWCTFVHHEDSLGRNSLHLAVKMQMPYSLIYKLLRNRVRTDTVCIMSNDYPLRLAVEASELTVVDLILAFDADVDYDPARNVGPAILRAVVQANVEMVRALLFHGANASYIDYNGNCLITNCIEENRRQHNPTSTAKYSEIIQILAEYTGVINPLNDPSILAFCPLSALDAVVEFYAQNGFADNISKILEITRHTDLVQQEQCALQHMAIVEIATSKPYMELSSLNNPTDMKIFYSQCLQELKYLNTINVDGMSIYNLVTRRRDHSLLLDSKEISKVDNGVQFCPHFASTLCRFMFRYQFESVPRNRVAHVLANSTGLDEWIICTKISSYLAKKDLQKFLYTTRHAYNNSLWNQ
ncbi:hypothetical protein QAD02_000745 [Eretmocerus hayati]|uniref:Uncharacterized protein n=1 Tax=Eretmocerus hayati TaxID=131215 RepID=A0ACC2NEG3_9HYME|nr:hypothetical protein QAD02_000745 [Eretmocerus hayati]